MKTCKKCGEEKALSLFPKSKALKSGYRNECKLCYAAYMRAYLAAKPEKAEANRVAQKVRDSKADKKAYKRHGVTTEQFEAMKAKHNGLCWACQERPGTSIDHDHSCCPGPRSCGKCVRGLLCHYCNTALGLAGDSPEKLIRLIHYLQWG